MIWKPGTIPQIVVSDEPTSDNPNSGHNDVNYYGGYLVAESIPRKEYINLIAAAPELLEALKEILNEAIILSEDYLEIFRDKPDDATIQGWDKARWRRALVASKKARAIIAKAEGKS
jgi:hypothetical protein